LTLVGLLLYSRQPIAVIMPDTPADQVQVFGISKGFKIFVCVVCIGFIALCVFVALEPFVDHSRAYDSGQSILLEAIGVIGIGMSSAGIAAVMKSRVEVYPDRICKVGLFSRQQLRVEEVQGFRIVPTQYVRILMLIPNQPKGKKMKIELAMARQADLLAWAGQHLTNLDAVDYQREMIEISQNDQLGATPEEKAARYGKVRKIFKYANQIGIVVFMWALFWPRPYRVVISLLALLPVAAMYLLWQYREIARFNGGGRKSAYPSTGAIFMLLCICIAVRALLDWHVLDWRNFWIPFAAFSLGILSVALLCAKDIRRPISTVVTCAVICAAYGYGVTVGLNGVMDHARPANYHARVLGRHFTSGRYATYELTLSPWGPRSDNEDVETIRPVYEEYAIGDTVTVWVHPGAFGIPYYFVR